MEGILNGYDEPPAPSPAGPSRPSTKRAKFVSDAERPSGSESETTRQWLKEQRRAEKRRRIEEKDGRKAERAMKRTERALKKGKNPELIAEDDGENTAITTHQTPPQADETSVALPPRLNSRAMQPDKRRSTGSAVGGYGTHEKETDEELRRRFKTPGAMNTWLASKWIGLAELQRLEAAGILAYKRGKFQEDEKSAIKEHLQLFQHVNRLDDAVLVNIIMGKGRNSERKDFPRFWPETAAQAPGRPVKAVKDHVKREYDPRGKKGAWTNQEDADLLRAYEIHPNEWARIAITVDRTEADCRDRYKNELRHKDTRNTGPWADEETEKLAKIVKETNEALGNDPLGYEAPWDIVCEKMGGTRSRTQCRKKWQDSLRVVQMSKGHLTGFSSNDRGLLLKEIKKLVVASERDIQWQDLCTGNWALAPPSALRQAFMRMKKEVKNRGTMAFGEMIDAMIKQLGVTEGSQKGGRRRKKIPKSSSHVPDTSRVVSAETVESEGENEVEEEVESEGG